MVGGPGASKSAMTATGWNNELERSIPSLPESDRDEVGVSRQEALHAETLGQRGNTGIDNSEIELLELSIDRRCP